MVPHTLLNALLRPSIVGVHNVAYLPTPNTVEVVPSDNLAPVDQTKTAFMVLLRQPTANLIMTRHRVRGIEYAGGHIEPGETAEAAAIRECLEETGYRATNVRPIGFLRMVCGGPRPEDWSYPFPVSFQQFFAGSIAKDDQPEAVESECEGAVEMDITDASASLSVSRLALYLEAVGALRAVAA